MFLSIALTTIVLLAVREFLSRSRRELGRCTDDRADNRARGHAVEQGLCVLIIPIGTARDDASQAAKGALCAFGCSFECGLLGGCLCDTASDRLRELLFYLAG